MNLPPAICHHRLPASHVHLRLWRQQSAYAAIDRHKARIHPDQRADYIKDARWWATQARKHWANYIEALIAEGLLSPSI